MIPQIGIGGAETQLCWLATLSDPTRARHSVLYYSESLDAEGFRVYREAGIDLKNVPRSRRNPAGFLLRLARTIRRERPDIVHCWLTGAALWGRWAGILASAPRIVVSFRNSKIEFPGLMRALEPFSTRRVNYLVNSHACARSAAAALGLPLSRFSVVHNGIDVGLYGPPCRRPPSAEQPWTIVTVARLTAQKNHAMLLRVAQRCRGALPVRFRIVGHGELEPKLHQLACDMGVEDTVEFLGLRRDVPALLRDADLFCFTTRWEGFPNALLEAMAAGLPIVSTRFDGADELIESGVHGTLVPIDDAEAAFQAISSYVAKPELAAQHGTAARQRMEDEFSMGRMVNRTLAYYQSLFEDRP